MKDLPSTNPRRELWLKDKNHIGFKLMQKMGWSEGKGLGANEDGMKDICKVRIKNNVKGVGYKNTSDSNWLEHQSEFNALLSRLNESNEGPSTQIMSLEKKSKSSRNRLHYHKFTRGKDLSKCSDKDLACILGKSKNEKAHADSASGTDLLRPDQTFGYGENVHENDNISTSKISSHEYFLQKQHKRKKDASFHDSEEGLLEAEKVECDPQQTEHSPLKKKKHKTKKETAFHDSETEKETWEPLQTVQCHLKKKHKRRKETCIDDVDCVLEVDKEKCDSLQTEQCNLKKKHKRKEKPYIYGCPEDEVNVDTAEIQVKTVVKKRKREELGRENIEDPLSTTQREIENGLLIPPKRRKVKFAPDSEKIQEDVQTGEKRLLDSMTEALKCTDTRSKKHGDDQKNVSCSEKLDDNGKGEVRLKKKKRKLKSCNEEVQNEDGSIQEVVTADKKKSKKTKNGIGKDNVKVAMEAMVDMEELRLPNSKIKSGKTDKLKLGKEAVDNDESGDIGSAYDTTQDDMEMNKKQFIIGLITTFRQPSENLADLYNDIVKMDPFKGSNFFSIKGYGREWL